MDELTTKRILAALKTQYLQLCMGNVYEAEAHGTAAEIKALYESLGGTDIDGE